MPFLNRDSLIFLFPIFIIFIGSIYIIAPGKPWGTMLRIVERMGNPVLFWVKGKRENILSFFSTKLV